MPGTPLRPTYREGVPGWVWYQGGYTGGVLGGLYRVLPAQHPPEVLPAERAPEALQGLEWVGRTVPVLGVR